MRRTSIVFLCISMFSFLVACSDKSSTESADLETVTFNMSWLPQGSMAGIVVAIENGYYAERGLDVRLTRGFGGIRTVNELDQGMFEFGYADPLAVILNRRNGGATRMIGAINQNWPAGICYIKERHQISTPADLAGMSIGGGQNSPMQVILPAWLKRNGLSSDIVTLMQLDPAVISTSVIEAQIDGGECWLGNSLAIYQKRAKEAGLSIGVLLYSDFNLDIYGSGLATTDALINEQPAIVAAFVDATYQGYGYARGHQGEALEMMLRHFPILDRSVTAQQISETVELMGPVDGVGSLDGTKVANTLSFLSQAYAVEKAMTADDIYTTQFLNSK
ncbi:MAG: ABC transporter substrate-binding protein [Pseudomonadales bacterium]